MKEGRLGLEAVLAFLILGVMGFCFLRFRSMEARLRELKADASKNNLENVRQEIRNEIASLSRDELARRGHELYGPNGSRTNAHRDRKGGDGSL